MQNDKVNFSVLFHRLFIIFAVGFAAVSCNNLPRDPQKTSERVQGGRLRVGLVEHPPFVIRTVGEPAGAEVELIRRFAREMNSEPEWHWGGEQKHLEALERFELDLVIGGFNDSTPWRNRIGLTSPYFKNRIVVGVPAALPPLKDISNIKVAVKRGEPAAAYLKNQGALPVRVDELTVGNIAVAAPEWKLEQLGLTATEIDLHTVRYVMLAPPGENGWISRLDNFLHGKSGEVKTLLQQEESRRLQEKQALR